MRALPLLALALAGCLSAQVRTIPPATQDSFDEQDKSLADRAAREAGGGPRRTVTGRLVLAPLVYSAAYDVPAKLHFPPLWSGVRQDVADRAYRKVLEGLRARGFAVETAEDLAVADPGLAEAGREPAGAEWSNPRAGKAFQGEARVSGGLKDWRGLPSERFASVPAFQAAVHVSGHEWWVYKGEARVNGEAVVTFDVHQRAEVAVCQGEEDCAVARAPERGTLTSTAYIPSSKAVDPARMTANGQAALEAAAGRQAALALAAFDAAVSRP